MRGLDVPLAAYLENGSNYETVRLIALSDRVYGADENYDVLFDSALEAIREHPGTYVRGVADAFWEFLMQAPAARGRRPREQTAPEPPPPTFEVGRRRRSPIHRRTCSSKASRTASSGAPPTTSTRARSTTRRSVWADPERQERYREIVAQVRAWDAELPRTRGGRPRHRAPEPHHATFPRPPFWLALGLVGLVFRRPRGWRIIVVLWVSAGLVLLIHAASQGVTPEFALPLYPVFIVTALGALLGGSLPKENPPLSSARVV